MLKANHNGGLKGMHSSLLKDGDGDSFSDTVDLFGGTHTQKFGAAAANRA